MTGGWRHYTYRNIAHWMNECSSLDLGWRTLCGRYWSQNEVKEAPPEMARCEKCAAKLRDWAAAEAEGRT